MNKAMYLFAAIVAFAFVCVVATYALRAYIRFRGKRLVTCPETKKVVAVEVEATHAAMTIGQGIPELRLKSCTRWPERQDCGQECVEQIELAPEDCLIRNILTSWYKGKACAYCHMRFGQIHLTDHKPALLNADRRIVEWGEIPPEKIPEALATHLPVCWNCGVAESFRLEHPELVTDRPWRHTAHASRR
jgi:hypothetical protein